jgi:cytochrome c oxidase subunit 2
MDTTGTLFMPPASSTVAPAVDTVFYTILAISVFFFVLVVGAATIFTIRYRRRGKAQPGDAPDHNLTLEIVWTVIPLIIVIVIFAMGFRAYLKQIVAPGDALEIKLSAQRWLWTFTYPNGVVSTNDLVVPAGKPIRLLMSSTDVIHGFYVPDFRIKQDILPNRYTTAWFEAPDPGEHVLTCSQYCGRGHSEMRGTVRVVTQGDYDKWLASGPGGPEQGVPPEQYGQSLYKSKGCVSCHTTDGSASVGPTFKDMYGKKVTMEDGKVMTADENYIRTCILEPGKTRLKGFPPVMPTFQGTLKETDIDALIAYFKSLSDESKEEGK